MSSSNFIKKVNIIVHLINDQSLWISFNQKQNVSIPDLYSEIHSFANENLLSVRYMQNNM